MPGLMNAITDRGFKPAEHLHDPFAPKIVNKPEWDSLKRVTPGWNGSLSYEAGDFVTDRRSGNIYLYTGKPSVWEMYTKNQIENGAPYMRRGKELAESFSNLSDYHWRGEYRPTNTPAAGNYVGGYYMPTTLVTADPIGEPPKKESFDDRVSRIWNDVRGMTESGQASSKYGFLPSLQMPKPTIIVKTDGDGILSKAYRMLYPKGNPSGSFMGLNIGNHDNDTAIAHEMGHYLDQAHYLFGRNGRMDRWSEITGYDDLVKTGNFKSAAKDFRSNYDNLFAKVLLPKKRVIYDEAMAEATAMKYNLYKEHGDNTNDVIKKMGTEEILDLLQHTGYDDNVMFGNPNPGMEKDKTWSGRDDYAEKIRRILLELVQHGKTSGAYA